MALDESKCKEYVEKEIQLLEKIAEISMNNYNVNQAVYQVLTGESISYVKGYSFPIKMLK
ncbi:hypothetical protein CIG11343_0587 [Campylobacter iguaniorum]|uniref:hypothetical protein n=1 Tax=Campylobacter iguaniorum TaxID=1244531 RepID=UPI0007C87E72|nr:hypothetical protein [Campylobacter iguaniorum]ANE35648.1 hypothetical protein CIG11343_0587 [Campylobacter iguaniorum]